MKDQKVLDFIGDVLANMPSDWLRLTTHRLDIYNESLAKTEFLDFFEKLYSENNSSAEALQQLPTAFDYIRLGHPLSCVLEWTLAKIYGMKADQVISFSSKITPVLAILRKNLLSGVKTQIVYTDELPSSFDAKSIQSVYGYQFELKKVNHVNEIASFDGTTVFIANQSEFGQQEIPTEIDFFVGCYADYGSIILVNGHKNDSYISEIQHVRRRETIAMTPAHCNSVINNLIDGIKMEYQADKTTNKKSVLAYIATITNSSAKAVVASSGLSMQYAIAMGLIDYANEHYPGKAIKFIVPPNCYGGTNDQARRVAACLNHVDVMDLPVDGDNDMVQSIDQVLTQVAAADAVPFIIAEIPTNPRVEVPNLDELQLVLSKPRTTGNGATAIDPVFILDQTFCPNVLFLGANDILSKVRTISYVSGSKFPSGGLCTAGYATANDKAAGLMNKIEKHLMLCDNEATELQFEILAKQLPSMNQRIQDAYIKTRAFVNFIQEALPTAKINFVSEELAEQGFTPSVFSLDLPTKGNTDEERENYKRAMNLKLIDMMIHEIPNESKYCVSYGQLKGCYWTIPATSTQGTTKEGDKDYIARVALSGNMDLERHQEVFRQFVAEM